MFPRLFQPADLRSFLPRALSKLAVVGVLALSAASVFAADWKLTKGDNDEIPGKNVSVTQDGKLVARFIYGEGQKMPYLAVYDDQGQLLTNAGLDKSGKTVGIEPHHRGIFIGWQSVKSDLGTTTFWGLGGVAAVSGKKTKNGPPATMEVVDFEKLSTTKDSATIVARIEWRAGTADASGNNLVVTETRTLKISRSGAGTAAQVDASFKLKPARDLKLDGNVQHAGVHMRVSHQVVDRADDTSYLWSPEGAPTAGKGYSKKAVGVAGSVVGKDLKWGEFLFPLHGRWYSAVQMNAPSNPVEEFSTREYGRFGFFFAKELKKNEELALNYRFIVRNAEAPAEAPKRSAAQKAKVRADTEAAYAKFLRETR